MALIRLGVPDSKPDRTTEHVKEEIMLATRTQVLMGDMPHVMYVEWFDEIKLLEDRLSKIPGVHIVAYVESCG